MKRPLSLLVLLAVPALAGALAMPVAAAPRPQSDTWAPAMEVVSQPYGPTYCWNEDDGHYRRWGGSLTVPFSATERMCDSTKDFECPQYCPPHPGWSAGAEGISVAFHTETKGGQTLGLKSVAIVSPGGSRHVAELMSSDVYKGVTRYNWAACWMPAVWADGGTPGSTSLAGGIWTATVDGSFPTLNTYLEVDVMLTSVKGQQMQCPVDQQNIIYA